MSAPAVMPGPSSASGAAPTAYRGRLAPSPTGYLHLGHARTFWTAQQRAMTNRGVLILRNEDLDHARCRPEFVAAMLDDLRWFGFEWQEGPDMGGSSGPYAQSERLVLYRAALARLQAGGFVYPCTCSRQDVQRAAQAPHPGEDEPVYPGTCRPKAGQENKLEVANYGLCDATTAGVSTRHSQGPARPVNWRFRVPDGETIGFVDGRCGAQQFIAGRDFGDFVVWRHDGVPSYQLACVVDDAAMRVTEVVRGEDLLRSTARQLLLYRAFGFTPPAFYHCPLVTDERGARLAKRHDALSLRALRQRGASPAELRRNW
jgi:glutamyl-tRNA synthetase